MKHPQVSSRVTLEAGLGGTHYYLTPWGDQVFEDILGYIMSMKAAWAT